MKVVSNRKMLEEEVDRTLELTSVCRSEWCRALECQVDSLRDEWNAITGVPTLSAGRPHDEVSRKIRAAYRNLGPDIHV